MSLNISPISRRRRISPHALPTYFVVNERINKHAHRKREMTYSGEYPTLKFVSGPMFRYRDTQELNGAKYLEAAPWVERWGLGKGPLLWTDGDDDYINHVSLEYHTIDGIIGLILFVDEGFCQQSSDVLFGHSLMIRESLKWPYHTYTTSLFESPRRVSTDIIQVDLLGQQPWSTVLPRDKAEKLLKYRRTELPNTEAAIRALFANGSRSLNIGEIEGALKTDHPYAYAAIMKMLLTGRLWQEDSERALDDRALVVMMKRPR